MAWYWIVLIVVAALFGLLFLAYMTNADMKLIATLRENNIEGINIKESYVREYATAVLW